MPEEGTSPSGGWRAVYGEMAVTTSAGAPPPDRRPAREARWPRERDPAPETPGRHDAHRGTNDDGRHARADD